MGQIYWNIGTLFLEMVHHMHTHAYTHPNILWQMAVRQHHPVAKIMCRPVYSSYILSPVISASCH